ncbi:Proline/betaine transporter [compost metagenome]
MEETEAFLDASQQNAEKPAGLLDVLRQNRRGVLVTMGSTISGTVTFYVMLVNMPTFASRQLGLPLDQVFMVQMLAVALMTLIIPLAGYLSDRIGRRPVLFAGNLAFFLLVYPMFVWVTAAPSLERLLAMQLLLCAIIGVCFGPSPTAMAEQFPTRVRSTGLALAYNVSVMLFGGFAPFIVTWLTKVGGTPVAPAYYVLFTTLIGLVSTYYLREQAPAVLERQRIAPLASTSRSI